MQFYNNRTTEDKDDLARSFSTHNLCHYLKLRKLLPGRGSYDSATRESPFVHPQATLEQHCYTVSTAKSDTLYYPLPQIFSHISPLLPVILTLILPIDLSGWHRKTRIHTCIFLNESKVFQTFSNNVFIP